MKPTSTVIDKLIVMVMITALFEIFLRDGGRVFRVRGYSSFLTLSGNTVVLPPLLVWRRLCILLPLAKGGIRDSVLYGGFILLAMAMAKAREQ